MASYSIIIPVKDEALSLPTLYRELHSTLKKIGGIYEIFFVDDGSTDQSAKVIKKLQKRDTHIYLIKFRGNFGKSTALNAGIQKARNSIVILLDADLQDNPNEIPKLIAKLNEGNDLVTGWRKKRNDSISKKISSYLFNRGTALISGVYLHDFNCGLKVMRRQVAQALELHGELHRFMPILAAKQKFKVTEVEVIHRSRRYGVSKFGFERSWRGILDLLTAIFILDYSTKPAHFFGRIGLVFFLIGVIFDGYVTYIKITTGNTQDKIPLLLAGVLFILLGVQLLSIGLIAEMISYYMYKKKKYEFSS